MFYLFSYSEFYGHDFLFKLAADVFRVLRVEKPLFVVAFRFGIDAQILNGIQPYLEQ